MTKNSGVVKRSWRVQERENITAQLVKMLLAKFKCSDFKNKVHLIFSHLTKRSFWFCYGVFIYYVLFVTFLFIRYVYWGIKASGRGDENNTRKTETLTQGGTQGMRGCGL